MKTSPSLFAFAILPVILWPARPAAAAPADDPALQPPPVNTAPGPEYADNTRVFQGIPGIERAANGRLWAIWYAGGPGEPGEGPGNYVLIVTSGDDGRTWSKPKLVIDPPGEVRAYDPCLWHDPQGRLWLFWAQSYQWWDGRSGVWAIVTENSGDENPRWSAPRRLGNGIMMNKPTVLGTGEWLLPVAVWAQKAVERTAPEHRHDLGAESGANVWVSRDRGETFSPLGQVRVPQRVFDEHSIIERRDGSLWMLVRAAYGIGESFSSDRGKTWTEGRQSSIPQVNSRSFIQRLKSGNLLLVTHQPPDKKTRSHLVAHLSDDDGATWRGGLMLDERKGVSYPDGVQSPDGVIRVIYDFERTKDKQILMAVFTERDVLDGKWASPQARQRVVVNQATGRSPKSAPKAAEVKNAVEAAHREIWKRFIDGHNIVLDYTALDGSIIRPTSEECRAMKPSALSWGVPVEDGPMFNGLYLDAMCNRWKFTRAEEDREKARRLVKGLVFLASVGKTPGFIARGMATDGKTTYSMGSNDQTAPWLYGMWRYLHDGLAEPDERSRLVAKFTEIVHVLDSHQWRMPCDGPPSPFRGTFAPFTWEAAPRLLFTLLAMHELTGEGKWRQRYLDAARESGGKNPRSRIEICRKGMVFDPGQGARHSWTGSAGVVCLRALWEMETEPALREAYAQGLRASAELSAKSLGLFANFNVDGTEAFENDWHMMNAAWKPQHSEADAVAVANAGLREQHRASPRLHLEKDWVREPCFAAWVVTLCPDDSFVARYGDSIAELIAHYRFDRLRLSQFFPLESAWYRLQQSGRATGK